MFTLALAMFISSVADKFILPAACTVTSFKDLMLVSPSTSISALPPTYIFTAPLTDRCASPKTAI